MSLKLTFSKVAILSFSRKPESGTIKISCSPSSTIAKALGWGTTDEKTGKFTADDFPNWQKSGTPTGSLAATLVEMAPSDTTRSKFAFDLDVSRVGNFSFSRTEIKKGKGARKSVAYKTTLEFDVVFTDPIGAQKLEAYMTSVAESTMKVTYEPEAVQDELPLAEDTQEVLDGTRKKATSKEAD